MRWTALLLLLACTDRNPAALSEGDLAAAEWPREGEADCSPSPEGAPACCLPREGECPKGGEWMDVTDKAWMDGHWADGPGYDSIDAVRGCYTVVTDPLGNPSPGSPGPMYVIADEQMQVHPYQYEAFYCAPGWRWAYLYTGRCNGASPCEDAPGHGCYRQDGTRAPGCEDAPWPAAD